MLMGSEVEPRRQFIEANAKYAKSRHLRKCDVVYVTSHIILFTFQSHIMFLTDIGSRFLC